MTIRPARAADIMRLLEIVEEGHRKSIYALKGNVDRDYTRQLFLRAVHMHGHSHANATFFLVSEKDGRIEGYFLGLLDRIYQVGDKLQAIDIHFYLNDYADRRDAFQMVKQFVAWGEGNANVIEIMMSKTDILSDDDVGFERLLARKDFRRCGALYRKTIERSRPLTVQKERVSYLAQ